jgi:aspartyl-tRNA(Asn)/glutamyl-tRNA(Gln) amidotransferase subunit A
MTEPTELATSPDAPWTGDACSLVDAYRAGERSPVEELEASLAAVERSELNAFSFLDPERARGAARNADVSLPFGGVPVGIKELDHVEGWPATEASLVLKDEISPYSSVMVERLVDSGGAVPFGLTTSSEFGGVNLTCTKLNGATRNPWNLEHTPGGSSGGAASAVAGGLCAIATGGDGGGSIRIPAGFTGLLGLKHTYGRIPKGPGMFVGSLTAVTGVLARSARDAARFLDVANGFDPRDPYSLPRVDGWEIGLDSHDLTGMRVAVSIDLGVATVHPDVARVVHDAAEALIANLGLVRVDLPLSLPELSFEWALAGLAEIRHDLGDRYPKCAPDLTREIRFGMRMATELYDLDARAKLEGQRTKMNEAVADAFDRVDFVIASSNPDIAFGAEGPLPNVVDGQPVELGNNGALTIPANIAGTPAVSIPVGTSRGLPVGMQVMAPHHREALLLDIARAVERDRPWPLTAPGAPR